MKLREIVWGQVNSYGMSNFGRSVEYRRVREAVEMLVGNADVDISVYLSTSNYLCKFKVAGF